MIGTTLSHYAITEELGRGGMGVVYKAIDQRLDRSVAVKVLPSEKTQSVKKRKRLVAEAKAASALNHPNILTIYEIDEVNGRMLLVMEYLPGETLRERMSGGPLSFDEIASVAYQIGLGLRVAHDSGIIHRDIKPSNIMLVDANRVKLMDFGLAKRTEGSTLTEDGQTVGTAGYMSPEQITGEKVDTRTDVWSFGVVLYEMLTGRRPFESEYVPTIVYAVLNTPAPDPSEDFPDLPESLCHITMRCLEKDRNDRFQDMSEVLAELDQFMSGVGISLNSGIRTEYRRQRRFFSVKLIVMLGVIGLLAIIAFPGLLPMNDRNDASPVFDGLRIVVLPPTLLGEAALADEEVEGLTYTLASHLKRLQQPVRSLAVVPTIDVLSMGVHSVSAADSIFGADWVISSTISGIGNLLTLAITLSDADELVVLDEVIIQATVSNMLPFEHEATAALASLLSIDLTRENASLPIPRGTTEPSAHDFYIRGVGYLMDFTDESKVNAAISVLESAVLADSGYARAHAGLGEAYWRKYETANQETWYIKALASANRAVTLDSTLSEAHATLGLMYRKQGRQPEAIRAYERSLDLDPNNATSLIGLAISLRRTGRFKEAEARFMQAISIRPYSYIGYNDLGIFYAGQNRHADAAEQFQRVIDLSPDNPNGYNNVAVMYESLDRSADAIPLYWQSIEVEPNSTAYRNLSAIYFFESADYTSAARLREDALALNDRDYRTWNQLGLAYYWTPDEHEKAVGAWEKVIELTANDLKINPGNIAAQTYLASAYASLRDESSALEAVNRLYASAPLRAGTHETIAYVYETFGYRDSSLVHAAQALEKGIDSRLIFKAPWFRDLILDPEFNPTKDAD